MTTPAPVSATPEAAAHETAGPPSPATGQALRIGAAFVAALVLLTILYLVGNVPAAWFPTAKALQWPARDLTVSHGTAALAGSELFITAPDANETSAVSVTTDFRAADYPAVAWYANNVPESADVRVLWRTDVEPQKLNYASVRVESGRLLPRILVDDPGWIGRVTGLALIVRTPLAQPLRIAGVEAKPMGAFELLRDRAAEWLALESWTGTSINTITGGADVQGLPLPLLLGSAALLAAGMLWGWNRFGRGTRGLAPFAVALLFIIGWSVLDARWIANLARQVGETYTQYGGKDWQSKHEAAPDGALFAFIEKARKHLPATAGRIYVAADAHFFRSRAAYHLYPHNVYADPVRNLLPPPETMRRGDWVIVYQRTNIQYDAAAHLLRWDGLKPVAAELKFADAGAALFEIQ